MQKSQVRREEEVQEGAVCSQTENMNLDLNIK